MSRATRGKRNTHRLSVPDSCREAAVRVALNMASVSEDVTSQEHGASPPAGEEADERRNALPPGSSGPPWVANARTKVTSTASCNPLAMTLIRLPIQGRAWGRGAPWPHGALGVRLPGCGAGGAWAVRQNPTATPVSYCKPPHSGKSFARLRCGGHLGAAIGR